MLAIAILSRRKREIVRGRRQPPVQVDELEVAEKLIAVYGV
jgi:hypothetical protein